MSVKEKIPSPPEKAVGSHTAIPAPEFPPSELPSPEADGREEAAPSPRTAGFILIVAGILLMALSGWTPTPDGTAPRNAGEASAAVGMKAASVYSPIGSGSGPELRPFEKQARGESRREDERRRWRALRRSRVSS